MISMRKSAGRGLVKNCRSIVKYKVFFFFVLFQGAPTLLEIREFPCAFFSISGFSVIGKLS